MQLEKIIIFVLHFLLVILSTSRKTAIYLVKIILKQPFKLWKYLGYIHQMENYLLMDGF